MQKIVFFGEPNDDAWITPYEIGNLFLSRFIPEVEEEDSFKLVKIFELGESSFAISDHSNDPHLGTARNKKGMSLSTYIIKVHFCYAGVQLLVQ